jgi:hypothetical protein
LHALDDHVGGSFKELLFKTVSRCTRGGERERRGRAALACQQQQGSQFTETYTVGNEKKRDGQLELVALELEISFETEQTGISDIDWTKTDRSAWLFDRRDCTSQKKKPLCWERRCIPRSIMFMR